MIIFVFFEFPNDRLQIRFCDVGQGDGTIISKKFNQIVVDGGVNNKILECLNKMMPFWDSKIELVVLTHPQDDHVTGLVELIKRYNIGLVIANGTVGESKEAKEFFEWVEKKDINVFVPKATDRMVIDGIEFEVLWPRDRVVNEGFDAEKTIINGQNRSDKITVNDVNELSVVLRMKYGKFVGLLTGDLGTREEQAMLRTGVLTDVVLLKVGHHGSKYSSALEFLRVIKPDLAVISAGKNNSFGHPTEETLARLESVGARIERTDERGDVVVVTDGAKWWVED